MAKTRTTGIRRLEPRQVLLAAGIAALLGLLYLPTLKYRFVWDDLELIVQNQDLQSPTPLVFFGQSYTHWPATHIWNGVVAANLYYRPLVISSFWLDRSLWGLRPAGFHLTNVLLNCAVCALVALVLADLLASFWPVLLGGLAFAFHTAHVEPVAFVSGRTDLMMTLFVLLAFLALLRFRRRPTGTWFGLTIAPFAAALLCKETPLLFPALALFTVLPELRQPARRRRFVLLLGAMAALLAVYLAVRMAVLTGRGPDWGGVGPGMRFMLAVNSFGRYALSSVVPFDRTVSYLDPVALATFGWPTLAAVAALAALTWAAVRYRSTAVGIGAVWFALSILPACDLLPPGQSYVSQRMLYLPTFGTVLAVAALGASLRRTRRVMAAFATLYAGVMGFAALRSMPVWRTPLSLVTAAVAQFPNDAKSRFELGRDLIDAGDWQGAARELRQSVRLAPGDTAAWVTLGDLLYQHSDFAGAAEAYRGALRLSPGTAILHNGLGGALLQTKDLPGAESEFRLALALEPDLEMARGNLGAVMVLAGKQDSAVVELRRALEIMPYDINARFNLGLALEALGRTEEARTEYQQVLVQNPGFQRAAERLRSLPPPGSAGTR
jgi:Flp pilus assembly protein TadD